jgi:ribosomal protein L37AE/L43A
MWRNRHSGVINNVEIWRCGKCGNKLNGRMWKYGNVGNEENKLNNRMLMRGK